MEIVKRRTVKSLVTKMSSVSKQTRIKSICELFLLTKNDPESCPIIVEANAIPFIAESLYSTVKLLQENSTTTLLNLSRTCKEHLMSPHGVLDALSHSPCNPVSPFSAHCAASTFFSLASFGVVSTHYWAQEGYHVRAGGDCENHGSAAQLIKDDLRALFGIALYPMNRAQMVELGTVQALFSLIVKDVRVGLVENASV